MPDGRVIQIEANFANLSADGPCRASEIRLRPAYDLLNEFALFDV
jgi:hypothetical protein